MKAAEAHLLASKGKDREDIQSVLNNTLCVIERFATRGNLQHIFNMMRINDRTTQFVVAELKVLGYNVVLSRDNYFMTVSW